MFNTPKLSDPAMMSKTPTCSSRSTHKRRARRYRIALMLALGMILGPACANQPLSARADGITVERLTSSHYEFSRVRVEPAADSLTVSGEVKRLIQRRGLIPGQVRIALIAVDGQLLEQTEVQPMRRNRQDQSAHFYARLASPAVAGNRLLIEHRGN